MHEKAYSHYVTKYMHKAEVFNQRKRNVNIRYIPNVSPVAGALYIK